jgi:hypothetical protein
MDIPLISEVFRPVLLRDLDRDEMWHRFLRRSCVNTRFRSKQSRNKTYESLLLVQLRDVLQ